MTKPKPSSFPFAAVCLLAAIGCAGGAPENAGEGGGAGTTGPGGAGATTGARGRSRRR